MSEETLKQEVLGAIEDVLIAVNALSTKMDADVEGLKNEMGEMKKEIGVMRTDLNYVQSQMVTKDYLDKRVSEIRGESIPLVRKEDEKLSATIGLLCNKDVISKEEQKVLLKMEPFPKLVP